MEIMVGDIEGGRKGGELYIDMAYEDYHRIKTQHKKYLFLSS